MKKLLFLVGLILISVSIHAQYFIGLNGRISHTNLQYDSRVKNLYVKYLKDYPSMSLNVGRIISFPFFVEAELEKRRMKLERSEGYGDTGGYDYSNSQYTNDVLNLFLQPGVIVSIIRKTNLKNHNFLLPGIIFTQAHNNPLT